VLKPIAVLSYRSMATHLQRWQQQIDQLKQELLALGDMRPGALSEQYNVCGKPNCRCKDPRKPKKHGPYYQLSYTHQGKSTTEFVKREMLQEVQLQLANYARFKELTEQWVHLSLRIAKLKRTQATR
jgi:hypothetical protein